MSLVNFDVLFLIQIRAHNLIHLKFFSCYKCGLKHLHFSKHCFIFCFIPFSIFFSWVKSLASVLTCFRSVVCLKKWINFTLNTITRKGEHVSVWWRWDASVRLNRLYVWIPRSWWQSCLPWTHTLTPLVRWEENWSLVSSDWPGSRTQEGGCKEGWGGRGARMVGDGRGEGRGGVTEQRGGGGKWWWMDWDRGGERGWRWTERWGDEGWGEGGLHQILLRRQGEEEWKQGRSNNRAADLNQRRPHWAYLPWLSCAAVCCMGCIWVCWVFLPLCPCASCWRCAAMTTPIRPQFHLQKSVIWLHEVR